MQMETRGKRIRLVVPVLLWLGLAGTAKAADPVDLWFPPSWEGRRSRAAAIAETLTENSGVPIRAQVAASYPEILNAFQSGDPAMVFAGSFVQAIIHQRRLGKVLFQSVDGKEFYSGVMIYPAGENPEAILEESPEEIAFTIGASSGESSAKAATGGKANLGVRSHQAAAEAVQSGKAKAAFVKNWWWAGNANAFPELSMTKIDGVSEAKNPDNMLAVSNQVSSLSLAAVVQGALKEPNLFGGQKIVISKLADLMFSINLMRKAGINPSTYDW
jgi:ABC-type phosphate/phosphonate transport system substrate-binding protein